MFRTKRTGNAPGARVNSSRDAEGMEEKSVRVSEQDPFAGDWGGKRSQQSGGVGNLGLFSLTGRSPHTSPSRSQLGKCRPPPRLVDRRAGAAELAGTRAGTEPAEVGQAEFRLPLS